MKHFIFPVAFMLGFQMLSAQYCGVSDSSQCMSPGLLTTGGLTPYYNIPPLTNDIISTAVIEVLSSDSITFQGNTIICDSMAIDTIFELPDGLCWSTNKPGNTFYGREDGCIKLTGTTCSPPGQYHPIALLNIFTSLGFPLTSEATNQFILRVINNGEVPLAFDTTGMYDGTIPEFIAYGPSAPCFPTGLSEINNPTISVKAFPNPFNDVTHIVVSGLNEKFGFELYDVTGRLQQSIPSIDNNQFEVHKGQLSNGVYLYRILVTGKPAAYGKLVVE